MRGGVVLGSLSGAHSEARLEAPGFIPAQWVAAAVPAGHAGGFKPLSQRQSSMLLAEKTRAGKQNCTHYQSLQETEAKGQMENDCCRKRSRMSCRNKEAR